MSYNCPVRTGAHLWIGQGLSEVVVVACRLKCQCLQIFLHSPRQWRVKKRPDCELVSFRKALKLQGLEPLVVHMPYLINLASPEGSVVSLSLKRLALELEEAETAGATAYVLHPGSHLGCGPQAGLKRLIGNLQKISGSNVKLLLENTAGQGQSLGRFWSGFREIRQHCPQTGFCLDTAHAWAAGYNLTSSTGFQSMLAEIEKTLGLEYIFLVHANGSAAVCGSGLDRHASLDRGKIGLEVFQWLAQDKYLGKLPFIIETPKNSLSEDRRNLKLLLRVERQTEAGAKNG
ncbi:MAG TPA: deoxyribonuclease IV [bacterium]|nr:deoxyribonuclease IV [bacterium]